MADLVPEPSSLQTVATLLQDIGYRAQVEPERDLIRSSTGGVKMSLHLGDDSLGVRCYFVGKDSHVQLQHVNEFNASYRFAKMYLDNDGDIVLACDFLFDARKDDAMVTLSKIIGTFEEAIISMKAVFRAAEDEAEAALAQG